jgi:EmrB/QacA subfamily drug resistance transporter
MELRVRNLVIALVVASVTFMELLDATILTTALPSMARSLSVTVIDLKAAITTYLVTLSIFIPISGWIADRMGCKRTLLAAIGLFTASSAACGMARSMELLVAFRALQGIGGALMTPVARLIIVRLFDRNELVRVAGLVAMPIVLGPVLGPLLGGYLTTEYSWPWVFWVNLPVGMVATVAIAWLAPTDRPQSTAPFDVRGFLAAGAGLALLTFILETLDNDRLGPMTLGGLTTAGLLLLGYAVVHCLTVPHPVFDLTLLRVNTFRVGVLQAVVGMIASGSVPLLMAMLLQTQLGYTPLESGGVLFCSALGALAIKPYITHLVWQFGQRLLLATYPLASAAVLLVLADANAHTPAWHFAITLFFYGCCQSVFMNMINAIPFLDLAPEQLSKATSLHGTALQFSMGLGVSLSALLLHGVLAAEHVTLGEAAQTADVLGAFRCVFLVLAMANAANALAGLSLSVSGRRLSAAATH